MGPQIRRIRAMVRIASVWAGAWAIAWAGIAVWVWSTLTEPQLARLTTSALVPGVVLGIAGGAAAMGFACGVLFTAMVTRFIRSDRPERVHARWAAFLGSLSGISLSIGVFVLAAGTRMVPSANATELLKVMLVLTPLGGVSGWATLVVARHRFPAHRQLEHRALQ